MSWEKIKNFFESREDWAKKLPSRAVWILTIIMVTSLFADIRIYYSEFKEINNLFEEVYLYAAGVMIGYFFAGLVGVKSRVIEAILTAIFSTTISIITKVHEVNFSPYKIILACWAFLIAIGFTILFFKKDQIKNISDENEKRKKSRIFLIWYWVILGLFITCMVLLVIEYYNQYGFRWNIYG